MNDRRSLEEQILRAKHAYYHGEPILSDAEYDQLEQQLRAICPTSPALKVGSIDPQRERRLAHYVGSLEKLYPEDFLERFGGYQLGSTYDVFPKYDGYALVVHWDDHGYLQSVCTRDGYVGKDKTYLAQALGIPLHLPAAEAVADDMMAVIEMILPVEVFEARYAKDFANPRNALNAIIASKTIHPMVKDVHLIGHHWLLPQPMPFDKPVGSIQVPTRITTVIAAAEPDCGLAALRQLLVKARETVPYEIDGLVLKPALPQVWQSVEFPDGEDPKFMVAFKENTQVCEAVVKDILWEPTAYGKLFPTLILNPVKLGGVTIENATAHHAKFVYDNQIGAGTRIVLTRGGDVIPKVERVIEAKGELLEAPSYLYPTWDGVHLRMADADSNDAVRIKRIYQFFKALEIEGVAESLIERMYFDAGMDTIPKILAAKAEDFLGLRKVQAKLATNIYNSIQDGLRRARLDRLMVASCCYEGIGRRLAEKVAKAHDWDFRNLSDNRLPYMCIEGVGPDKAEILADNAGRFKHWLVEIQPFLDAVPQDEPQQPAVISTKLAGVVAIFTGFRDENASFLIEANGGRVATSMSKKVTHVIAANPNSTSTKLRKAAEQGCTVWSLSQLKDFINGQNQENL